VVGLQLARQERAVQRFYQKKAKQIGQAKAQVAAARKLSAVVWWILTNRLPYQEQDEGLSARKGETLDRVAAAPPPSICAEELRSLGEERVGQADTLERLERESGFHVYMEEEEESGNGWTLPLSRKGWKTTIDSSPVVASVGPSDHDVPEEDQNGHNDHGEDDPPYHGSLLRHRRGRLRDGVYGGLQKPGRRRNGLRDGAG